MYRELLTADRSRTCEQTSLILAVEFLKHLKYALVVEICVVVVHSVRIGAVAVYNIGCGYSLTEVRLECVNAHLAQRSQLCLVPLASLRIRKVNDSHTGLPHITLEHTAVRLLDEVAVLYALVK